ncbi:MAG: ribosome silencing factor [Acidobacteriota bacterium]
MPAGVPFILARTKKLLKQAVPQQLDPLWLTAVHAAESKQAQNILALDLRDVTTFADTLIICHGANSRQNQTISNEIEVEMKKYGDIPSSVEGYTNAEWILMDYGDYVINIFSEKTRAYYDLERLWRDAKPIKY